jgi:hypothetical protein
MTDATLKHLLAWGLGLATAPAILFFPAVAFLTVCPPSYGRVATMTLSAVFVITWLITITVLVRVRRLGSRDAAISAGVWPGIGLSTLGVAFTIYGVPGSFGV